ncbi:MAG: hypothetical protein ACOX6U_09690 [Oscillospiraceae bacterium]|jgi:hypothetical protein
MIARFRAPEPHTELSITVPVYSCIGEESGVELAINRKRGFVGTRDLLYLFSGGQDGNELTLDIEEDFERVCRLREYIASHPEYQEIYYEKPPKLEKPIQHKVDRSAEWDEQYSRMLRR